VADFKKPFKAVPLRSKRLKGLDEFDRPLLSFRPDKPAINWIQVAIGLFIGICLGLAWVFGGA